MTIIHTGKFKDRKIGRLRGTRWRDMCIAIIVLVHATIAAILWGGGSSLLLIVVMSVISMIGFFSICRKVVWPSDFFIFGLAMYSGTVSLLVKTVLGQQLQENLFNPNYSASIIFLGFVFALLGAEFARTMNYGRVLGPFHNFAKEIKPFGYFTLILVGAILFVLHVELRPRFVEGVYMTSGFGGFGSFYFVLILGVTLLFYHKETTGRRFLRISSRLMLFIFLIFSILANTKKEFADVFLAMILATFFFGRGFSARLLIRFGVIAAIFFYYISPVLHLMRNDFVSLSLSDRVNQAAEILIENRFNPVKLIEKEGAYISSFTHSHSSAGSYIYPSKRNLDRFFLILPIDQVSRGQLEGESIGLGLILQQSLETVLPGFIITKDSAAGADYIAWKFGIRADTVVGRPVIGLSASLLAIGGPIFVCLGSFLIVAFSFFFYNRIFGSATHSPIAVFFIVISSILYEKELDAFLSFPFRDALLFSFSLFLLQTLTKNVRASDRKRDNVL